MTREEAIVEFIKGLRIAFNNACAYNKEHPYFKKTIEDFKQKIGKLFSFLNPIQIGITPKALFIDGKYWQKSMLYEELASLLHLRKIKSIQINKGVSVSELMNFLSAISKPTKEIIKQGGLQNILSKEVSPNVKIEQLDYSQFLRGEGEESGDIWSYLFQQAVNQKDSQLIDEFADNFESIIGKFKTADLIEDEELRKSIYNFLGHLREEKTGKFSQCAKELLKFVLKSKDIKDRGQLDKIKDFFKDLDNEDFAQILLEEILNKERFDNESFQVFMQITNTDNHKQIASSLGEKLKGKDELRNNPIIRKNIKEIFSVKDVPYVSTLYSSALDYLMRDGSSGRTIIFDEELIQTNYYFILLNLFLGGDTKEELDGILETLSKECDRLIDKKDLDSLKFLMETLDKKTVKDTSIIAAVKKIKEQILSFIETAVFQDEGIGDIEYFVGKINNSFIGFNYYMSKIFVEGKVNTLVFKLLLKLFSGDLPYVYERLQEKQSDIDFLMKVIKSLGKIDSAASLEMLKRIYQFSNNLVKIEILNSMWALIKVDDAFLISILNKGEVSLRKAALPVLIKHVGFKDVAFKKMFDISSFLGIRNKIILENIGIIEALSLKDAQSYLSSLSKRPFFWNRDIRKRAREILRNWNAG